MPSRLDLTGKIFKTYKVDRPAPSYSGHTYWICLCQECQTEREIQTNHLKNNRFSSCPCQENEYLQERQCVLCKTLFLPKERGYTRKYCYECSPSYEKGSNKARGENIIIKRRAIKQLLVDRLGGQCKYCGYKNSLSALHFHHTNPNEKDFGIANHLYKDLEFLYSEVDKCELVCANCHAELHHEDD